MNSSIAFTLENYLKILKCFDIATVKPETLVTLTKDQILVMYALNPERYENVDNVFIKDLQIPYNYQNEVNEFETKNLFSKFVEFDQDKINNLVIENSFMLKLSEPGSYFFNGKGFPPLISEYVDHCKSILYGGVSSTQSQIRKNLSDLVSDKPSTPTKKKNQKKTKKNNNNNNNYESDDEDSSMSTDNDFFGESSQENESEDEQSFEDYDDLFNDDASLVADQQVQQSNELQRLHDLKPSELSALYAACVFNSTGLDNPLLENSTNNEAYKLIKGFEDILSVKRLITMINILVSDIHNLPSLDTIEKATQKFPNYELYQKELFNILKKKDITSVLVSSIDYILYSLRHDQSYSISEDRQQLVGPTGEVLFKQEEVIKYISFMNSMGSYTKRTFYFKRAEKFKKYNHNPLETYGSLYFFLNKVSEGFSFTEKLDTVTQEKTVIIQVAKNSAQSLSQTSKYSGQKNRDYFCNDLRQNVYPASFTAGRIIDMVAEFVKEKLPLYKGVSANLLEANKFLIVASILVDDERKEKNTLTSHLKQVPVTKTQFAHFLKNIDQRMQRDDVDKSIKKQWGEIFTKSSGKHDQIKISDEISEDLLTIMRFYQFVVLNYKKQTKEGKRLDSPLGTITKEKLQRGEILFNQANSIMGELTKRVQAAHIGTQHLSRTQGINVSSDVNSIEIYLKGLTSKEMEDVTVFVPLGKVNQIPSAQKAQCVQYTKSKNGKTAQTQGFTDNTVHQKLKDVDDPVKGTIIFASTNLMNKSSGTAIMNFALQDGKKLIFPVLDKMLASSTNLNPKEGVFVKNEYEIQHVSYKMGCNVFKLTKALNPKKIYKNSTTAMLLAITYAHDYMLYCGQNFSGITNHGKYINGNVEEEYVKFMAETLLAQGRAEEDDDAYTNIPKDEYDMSVFDDFEN